MKQFRKLLAVLSAALLLCAVLPLSALVNAGSVSYDGYFYNKVDKDRVKQLMDKAKAYRGNN